MKRLPTHMKTGHTFSQVPRADIPRSQFDRSNGLKTTFDVGWLIPVFVDEALPGDTYKVKMAALCRLATPLKPLMDNLYLESFFFFVPNRLLWDNWEKFNGSQENPGDSTSFVNPVCNIAANASTIGSIYDYFGLPAGAVSPAMSVNTLPFRAYALCYNEWFRDENLQSSVAHPKTDGPDTDATFSLRRRGKRHDYFTSCLPWPQKGTAVPLPLSGTVVSNDIQISLRGATENISRVLQGTQATPSAVQLTTIAAGGTQALKFGTGVGETGLQIGSIATTINDLRQAYQIQRLYERDARGGTRYTEILKAHFGVTSPDARLQRSEYLGGGSSPVVVSPIAQTGVTVGQTPLGNLAAVGSVGVEGHGFVKSFTEHGIIIGLVSVRGDLTYQQGVDRFWKRSTRFDYYWPALSHIGEQAVMNGELYYQNTGADIQTFGYQERYAEYRYKRSYVTGQFRSSAAGTLDFWHLADKYTVLPTLSSAFIVDDLPVDRVIAVPAEPHFIGDFFFNTICARPMPVFGVPGLIDHF